MKPTKILDAARTIEKRMMASYENPYDFHRRSGVSVAYYTIVRFLDPNHDKPPSIPTLIEIAHYAGMSNDEISNILESIGDNFWHKLIGANSKDSHLTPKEKALLGGVRKVVKEDQTMWQQFGSTLKLTAAAVGIEVKEELAVIG